MNLAIYPPVAEPSGNKDAVYPVENFILIFYCNGFGVHPFNIYCDTVGDAAVF